MLKIRFLARMGLPALPPRPFVIPVRYVFFNSRQVEEERRWFSPATARRTETLLRRRMPQRLEETVEERVKRMTGTDDQRRRYGPAL